jgi:hypothetical protein
MRDARMRFKAIPADPEGWAKRFQQLRAYRLLGSMIAAANFRRAMGERRWTLG